ncbi:sigma factor-like helix-turn-helix DNA-binding protein [Mobiluncus curtisii]|uniref:Sigma-70, region 4 n=2 Tax=Mobiluncus curtisii TaxID=2051 RepID=D6ZG27_MOBCV|nr:sigma-70 region 4 domain-containing protein [Mobiluncus curtisii]ADI67585.1 sigma-70, region 4 [Mobiluncus curtisii ATCC 43063]NMW89525.1 hypothetical protein [Mobiluncus curtisii]QQU08706.1 hypothetical protein I6I85_00510 [Mobiluncus curtisii]SQB65087.1 Sigma-70, region 4 [Mobiluncus curtisii]
MSTTDNNQNHVTFRFDFVTDEHIEVQLPSDSPIAQALLEHDARWKKTNRADTRRDRHSSPSEFPKEGMHFAADIDIERDFLNKQAVATTFAGLSKRQRFLIEAVVLDGYSFAELARAEHKDESAIRHAYNRAIKRARKILEADRPESTFGVAYRARQQQTEK